MARNAETLPAQGHRARDAAGVRRKAGNVPIHKTVGVRVCTNLSFMSNIRLRHL